jgi:hypothetical protein
MGSTRDARRASRRQVCGAKHDGAEHDRGAEKRDRIGGLDAEQQAPCRAAEQQCRSDSEHDTGQRHCADLAQHHRADSRGGRTEREAQRDLARALCD